MMSERAERIKERIEREYVREGACQRVLEEEHKDTGARSVRWCSVKVFSELLTLLPVVSHMMSTRF